MLSNRFQSCALTPLTGNRLFSSSAVQASDGKWNTSSFYLDSSGRSSIPLPLRLKFPSKETLQDFLNVNCIQPLPSNVAAATEKNGEEESKAASSSPLSTWTLDIEARVTDSIGSGEAITAVVEGVTISSTIVEDDCIIFNTQIIVRVTKAEGSGISSGDASGVKTNIELTAVLCEERPDEDPVHKALVTLNNIADLKGLPDLSQSPSERRIRIHTKLPPLALDVSLTQALSVTVKNISGPAPGRTFLILNIKHSNTHSHPVTIRNIALHPGHSWLSDKIKHVDARNPVVDMSKSVKWGYAPRTDPQLPLTLQAFEAATTVIEVDATEDYCSRVFSCHVSVMAALGKSDESIHHHHVIAATPTEWRTSRAAVEPADAFRVDMKLSPSSCVVGNPLNVLLDIYNLSPDARDLVLVVNNDDESANVVRTPVVSEKDGIKFGVWGLADSASLFLDRRERDLLSVDMALVLGELKGQTSIVAELRLIPIREGTLSVPNFKIVDKRKGQWYSCIHKLTAVAYPC